MHNAIHSFSTDYLVVPYLRASSIDPDAYPDTLIFPVGDESKVVEDDDGLQKAMYGDRTQ